MLQGCSFESLLLCGVYVHELFVPMFYTIYLSSSCFECEFCFVSLYYLCWYVFPFHI